MEPEQNKNEEAASRIPRQTGRSSPALRPKAAPLQGTASSISNDSPEKRSLADLQNERRKYENDAKILANRVSLLKHEEAKTLRRIEETRRKAIEVYLKKREIEERNRKKEMEAARMQYDLKSNQKDTVQQRTESQKRIQELKKMLQDQKHQDMLQMRDHRMKIEKSIELQKKENLIDRQLRAMNVRQMEAKVQQRLQTYKEERSEIARENYEEKKRREMMKQDAIASDINKLEKTENQLLGSLLERQTLHRDAYNQLENALALPTAEFIRRYKEKYGVPPPERSRYGNSYVTLNRSIVSGRHSEENKERSLSQTQNEP
eukprot:TRINITY_DN9691_c0_g1_i2.p1 TRINITY_DN9691_c0_g1~~TRINITY_DN9691_c0_g1_i2.p1  ORF type:complete len:319 (-),score=102.91 TRINITY_DN9691_c0_g1_i2:113-1069(-)